MSQKLTTEESTQNLLSHAEVVEDVVEDLVGGDFAAGDFGEVKEGLAEVFADEVAAELLL